MCITYRVKKKKKYLSPSGQSQQTCEQDVRFLPAYVILFFKWYDIQSQSNCEAVKTTEINIQKYNAPRRPITEVIHFDHFRKTKAIVTLTQIWNVTFGVMWVHKHNKICNTGLVHFRHFNEEILFIQDYSTKESRKYCITYSAYYDQEQIFMTDSIIHVNIRCSTSYCTRYI